MINPHVDRLKGWIQAIFRFLNLDLLKSKNMLPTINASGLLLLANLIVMGLGILRTPLITWMIPKDQVGMLAVVLSWLPFVSLLSLPGIDSSAYHFVSKGETNAFVIGVIHRIRWSLLSALAFGLGSVVFFIKNENQTAWLFFVAALSFPFTYGLTAPAGILGAIRNYKGLFWYRILESLTDFAGFIPLIFSVLIINKITTFYTSNQIATAIMQIFVVIWLIKILRKEVHQPPHGDLNSKTFHYGKHLSAITGISVVQSRLDAFLVGLSQPLNVMADYSVALILQEQLRRLWGVYTTIRYPVLVRMPKKPRLSRFILEGGLFWISLTMVSFLVAILAHWLVPLILPPSYAGSLVYMDLLIIAVLVGVPGGLVELFFRTEQDEKSQYKIRIMGVIWSIIFPPLFLYYWGANGAAVGRILANAAFSISALIVIYWNLRKIENT